MTDQTTTMSSNGDITLSPEIQAELGLRGGSRFSVKIEAGQIVLRPHPAVSLRELQTLLASDHDIVAALHEERRQDNW